MSTPMDLNREHWDESTDIHSRGNVYGIEDFKAGRCQLHRIEVEELGDVSGKRLLHLQCHFGLGTLSWARRGAIVTGVDFSPKAIALARSLAAQTGIEARFVESNIYGLTEALSGRFDVVFTSYGVLCWLPDLPRWAEIVAHYRELIDIALSSPAERGLPFSAWTVPKLAEYCRQRGLLPPITDEWVRRLLRREGLRAQRIRTWKTSHDPAFDRKKNASGSSTRRARRARR